MNGMISRTSGNSPPLLNLQILQSKAQAPVQASKRHCSSSSSSWWPQKSSGGRSNGGAVAGDQYIGGEPTSVLDIRSPSPPSTLSSTQGASSESGAVAAFSGLFCEAVDGQAPRDPLLDIKDPAPPPPSCIRLVGGGAGGPWYSIKNSGNNSGKWSGEGSNWRLNGGESSASEPQRQQHSSSKDEQGQHQQQGRAEEWAPELGEFQAGGGAVATAGMEDLESMLMESSSAAPDQSLMRWLLGESDDPKDLTAVALPQIKGGSAPFEDGGIDNNFTDAGGFPFPVTNLGDVLVPPTSTPSLLPPPPNPSAFCTPYPALPQLSRLGTTNSQFGSVLDSAPPPAPTPPLSFASHFGPGPEPPVFSAPNSLVFGSSPHHATFFKDPAHNNINPSNNNVFFPVSYEMAVPQPPKRLHGVLQQDHLRPPPPPPPPLLWQQNQQGSIPGGFVKQEFMFKTQQHADVLQSLQRRQQQLFMPQLQRAGVGAGASAPKGILGNNKAISEELQHLVGQLLKAAEAVESGTFGHAQAILARLNQYLSPLGKPLHRAAYYFKEALGSRITNETTTSGGRGGAPPLTPVEIVHKISAYKYFSEVSPLALFANFTANQALLEALDGAEAIHIIDFEIGLGGQWASFLQELALRMGGPPSLRLTALGARDSVEMHLARENLEHFAKDLNIKFEFNVLDLEGRIESLALPMLQAREHETVAVNLSLGMHRFLSAFPSPDSIAGLLRLIKDLSPKAVVVVDGESERTVGASFVQQFVEGLQFYSLFFDSLDAVNMNMETVHKIEKFLLAPKIESLVVTGLSPLKGTAEQQPPPPWRALFVAAGLAPVPFSNFTETQAEYLVRRLPGRGFEVIKEHTTLLLGWQGRPLVSAMLWRC
uniref:Uncharacterized protein n=1 Tax=Araucaria cunninghamii TaxID=56994 RepID=A0A0D6QX39_ARACU